LNEVFATKLRVAEHAERVQALTKEAYRMFFQRKPGRHVILDDMFAQRHGGEYDIRLGKNLVAEMRRQ
jgi:hypothetical protein